MSDAIDALSDATGKRWFPAGPRKKDTITTTAREAARWWKQDARMNSLPPTK